MSDTSTQATQDNGTQTQASATDAAPAKLYASKVDCEANKPSDATKNHKPYEVSKNGTVLGWLWARGYDHALALTARSEGYSASVGNAAPVTKEVVAAKLAEFSDADLADLGLKRQPQKGAKR
jgi:hypothetical protein